MVSTLHSIWTEIEPIKERCKMYSQKLDQFIRDNRPSDKGGVKWIFPHIEGETVTYFPYRLVSTYPPDVEPIKAQEHEPVMVQLPENVVRLPQRSWTKGEALIMLLSEWSEYQEGIEYL